MFSSKIIPAIIPRDQSSLLDFADSLHGVPELHVDVTDGKFVVPISWPYTPVGNPQHVAASLARYTLEVDLMVEDSLSAAEAWIATGADLLVFHIESTPLAVVEYITQKYDVTVGVCANNDTPHEALLPYLDTVDYVQIMGIATIGSQGQPFDERALARLLYIRTVAPRLLCSIDGSVNLETMPHLQSESFDRYIVGSAIYKSDNPQQAYQRMIELEEGDRK